MVFKKRGGHHNIKFTLAGWRNCDSSKTTVTTDTPSESCTLIRNQSCQTHTQNKRGQHDGGQDDNMMEELITPVAASKRSLQESSSEILKHRRIVESSEDGFNYESLSWDTPNSSEIVGKVTPVATSKPLLLKPASRTPAQRSIVANLQDGSNNTTPDHHMGLASIYDPTVVVSCNYLKQFRRRRRPSAAVTVLEKKAREKRRYERNKDAILERKLYRYHNSPTFTQNVIKAAQERYRMSSPLRRRKVEQCVVRYATDSSYCKKQIKSARRSFEYRYSNPETRKRYKTIRSASTLRHYHDDSPYRRSSIRCIGAAIKRKYNNLRAFRLRHIGDASERYRRIMKSSSKKRSLRLKQRDAHQRQGGERRVRRRILYQDDERKSRVNSGSRKYQASSKLCQEKKKIYDRERKSFVAASWLAKKKSLAVLLMSRRRRRMKRPSGLSVPMIKRGTVEYRRIAQARWKRYKINYLLSTCIGQDKANDKSNRTSVAYGQLKLKVGHLLDQILVWQRQQRSVLYGIVSRLSNRRCEAEALVQGVDDDAVSATIQEFYGGKRYHVSTHEAYRDVAVDHTYTPLSSLDCVDARVSSKSASATTETLARFCNERCDSEIPTGWAESLHTKMKLLDSNVFIQKLLINVYEFQQCDTCSVEEELCSVMENCGDMMRLIYALKPHFVGLRTLTNILHQMHAAAFELHLLELLLKAGTYDHCLEFKNHRFPDEQVDCTEEDNEQEDVPSVLHQSSDKYVIDTYGLLYTAFVQGLRGSMPIHECCSCLKLVGKLRLRSYEHGHKFLNRFTIQIMLEDYKKHFGRPVSYPVTICNPCDALLKKDKSSSYCRANDMWPVAVPPELACLNVYEQQLVAICKCFMQVIRLQPYQFRGVATSSFAKGVKGLAVHVPLPSGTMKKACDIPQDIFTLPNYSKFMIEVDGLPNVPKKLLFRSLVDVAAVMAALKWLKQHNHLYKNAVIDETFLLLDDSHLPHIRLNENASSGEVDEIIAADVDREDIAENDVTKHCLKSSEVDGSERRKVMCAEEVDKDVETTDLGTHIDEAVCAVLKNQGMCLSPEGLVDGSAVVERISDVIEEVLAETEIDCMLETVSKQRFSKRIVPSFIDARNAEAPNVVAPSPDNASGNNSAADKSQSRGMLSTAEAIKKAVSQCNFPIPYAVPYKQILLDHLRDKTSMLMHVPGHEILESYSIIELEPSIPKGTDLQLFAMKPVEGDPLRSDDPNLDVACFPILFPDGRNGLCHERRTVTPAYYYEHRFEMSDRRFCRDQCYLLDTALRKDMAAIHGSIYTMLNTGRFGKLTAGEMKKRIQNPPDEADPLPRNILSLLGSVVGSVPYWLRVRRNLEAMVEELGPATFFLTLSCAEYKNEDFKEFLELRNWDLPNVRNIAARTLASCDPVSVAVHFHNRFTAFWDKVIMDRNGPLGVVENFYIKKEYQQRGAPHMHILLWIADAPIYGKASNDEVLQFIQKHICCTVPDPLESPVLHKLVLSCQMHKCTKSCLRTISFHGKYFSTICRYGFPRKVSLIGQMNKTEDVLQARASGKRRIKLYYLRRTKYEQNVNDYNPALLYIWRSNMDLQYIGEASMSLTYYASIYSTKYEKQNIKQATENINQSLSKAKLLKSVACKMMKARELGVYEAADKILRHPMHRMSVDVKSGAFFPPTEMQRRLKTRTQIEQMPDSSEDIYCKSLRCTYYPSRPESMANLSLYDVLTNFNLVYGRPKKATVHSLPEHGVYFTERKKKAVISIWNPKSHTPESYNNYCFQLVILFKPWRKEEELLKDLDGNEKSSYFEVYEVIREQLKDLQVFEQSKKRLKKMLEWAEEVQRKATEKAEQQALVAATVDDTTDELLEEFLFAQSAAIRQKLTPESVRTTCDSLNEGQRKVFDMIIKGVELLVARAMPLTSNDGMKAAEDSEVARNQTETSRLHIERIFVSGVGGTGKSHLIRACRDYVEFHYSKEKAPAVLVAAPTGIAALNIEGVTVHKLLKLPIQKSKRGSALYRQLKPNDVKELRFLFRNVKLVIIDEVSMLSSINFLFIHRRLNEILVNEDESPLSRFGDINILLLGDLLQLPPVEGSFIFQKATQCAKRMIYDTICYDLSFWKLFSFVELTKNMRQRDDLQYAELLSRVRIGSPTADDLVLMRSRLINSQWDDTTPWDDVLEASVAKYMQLMEHDPTILCLMPLNASVDAFNTSVMSILKLQTFTVQAVDVHEDMYGAGSKRSRKKRRTQLPALKEKKKLKTADTGGLEESLTLAVGVRIMLRRNSETDSRLVNGSIGVIQGLCYDRCNTLQVLNVKFSGRNDIVPITKITAKYNITDDLYVFRTQFPVTVAYAITIHKCQGLSLDTAMVDIGTGVFNNGMGYVALSRIKTLRNLHLMRFCAAILKADTRCIQEYNRLRRSAGISELISGYNKNPEMMPWKPKVSVSVELQKQQLMEEVDVETKLSKGLSKHSRSAVSKTYVPVPVSWKDQAITADVTEKQKRVVAERVAPLSRSFLMLSNPDNHSCFANASVQCLFRCLETTPSQVLHSQRGNEVGEAFFALFQEHVSQTSTILSVNELRNAFGAESQFSQIGVNRDCDAREFLETLIGKLPDSLSCLFVHHYEEAGRCKTCNALYTRCDLEDRVTIVGTFVDADCYRFNEVFSETVELPARCAECQTMDFHFSFDIKVTFPPSNRFLLLSCPVQGAAEDLPLDMILAGLKADGNKLYGQKWSVIATIQLEAMFKRDGTLGRHFLAFVRLSNNNWVRLNDSAHRILQRKPPFKNMVLYVLERTVRQA